MSTSKYEYLAQEFSKIFANNKIKVYYITNRDIPTKDVTNCGILQDVGTTFYKVQGANEFTGETNTVSLSFYLSTDKATANQMMLVIDDKMQNYINAQSFTNDSRVYTIQVSGQYTIFNNVKFLGKDYMKLTYNFTISDQKYLIDGTLSKVFINGTQLNGVYQTVFTSQGANTPKTNSNGEVELDITGVEHALSINYYSFLDDDLHNTIEATVNDDLSGTNTPTEFTVLYYKYYNSSSDNQLIYSGTMAVTQLVMSSIPSQMTSVQLTLHPVYTD